MIFIKKIKLKNQQKHASKKLENYLIGHLKGLIWLLMEDWW